MFNADKKHQEQKVRLAILAAQKMAHIFFSFLIIGISLVIRIALVSWTLLLEPVL
jgi:hypothetical protein